MDIKRKEILVAYSSIQPIYPLEEVVDLAANWAQLEQKQKRDVFTSIKMGSEKERALALLYMEEQNL